MSATTYHVNLSVRGVLSSPVTKQRWWARGLSINGRTPNLEEFQRFLMDALAAGSECIDIAGCTDFDPKSGCRGHPDGQPTTSPPAG